MAKKEGPPDMRGKVDWRGGGKGGAGYVSGHEELNSNPSFTQCDNVYLFCREVAIAKKDAMHPENSDISGQMNVLTYAQKLLATG